MINGQYVAHESAHPTQVGKKFGDYQPVVMPQGAAVTGPTKLSQGFDLATGKPLYVVLMDAMEFSDLDQARVVASSMAHNYGRAIIYVAVQVVSPHLDVHTTTTDAGRNLGLDRKPLPPQLTERSTNGDQPKQLTAVAESALDGLTREERDLIMMRRGALAARQQLLTSGDPGPPVHSE